MMSDLERWEAMVLAKPGAQERVADIETELRHEVLRDTAGSEVEGPAQARRRVNSEDV